MTPEEKHKVQKVFSTAHHSKKDLKVSGQFTSNVMRRIRNLDQTKEAADIWDFFQPAIWRFVSPPALVAMALFVYVAQTGFLPEYEVAQLLLEDMDAVFRLSPIR